MKPIVLAAAAVFLIGASPQVAHSQSDQPAVVDLPDIEVSAQATRAAIRSFVGQVTSSGDSNGQTARFERRICPGVVNIGRSHAQVINDRIAAVALLVDLPVGAPGCDPNVLVIFTDRSDVLAQRLVADHPRTFVQQTDGLDQGRRRLEDFLRPGSVVRWWQLTEEDGGVQDITDLERPHAMGGLSGDSRLRAAYRTDLFRTILIVDLPRANPVALEALGDYLAFRALAETAYDADTSSNATILNLFAQPRDQAPSGLTEWDVAYLKALYSARNYATGGLQRGDVAGRMARALRASDAPTTADADPRP